MQQSSSPAPMPAEILVVGCGSIGERHLRCLQRTHRSRVSACDSNSNLLQRIVQQYAVRGFESFEQALAAQKYDGVVICTPAHTHLALALRALGTGAGLLIEKPLSTRLDQVNEVGEMIRRSGQFVGVAYVYHFMPWVKEMRQLLLTGELGRPLHASVVAGQHFPTFRPAYRDIYYARHQTGGGAIQDALTHLANAMEWLVGPTSRLFCDAAHQALDGVNVEDTVNVTARNGSVLVNYCMNQFQAPNEAVVQVHCENGSIRFEGHRQRWSVYRRNQDAWEDHRSPPLERDDIFVAQANAFLDGLAGKPTDFCTFDESVHTLKFNLAALESARTGLPVVIK